jgi:hypothetical protein
MFIKMKDRIICSCDMPRCYSTLSSDSDIAWQKPGIVFGIHPEITEEIYQMAKMSICVPKNNNKHQRWFHFCPSEFTNAMSFVYDKIIERTQLNDKFFSSSDKLIRRMGCWITITDVLGGNAPINYQVPYGIFADIYRTFLKEFCIQEKYYSFSGTIINSAEDF